MPIPNIRGNGKGAAPPKSIEEPERPKQLVLDPSELKRKGKPASDKPPAPEPIKVTEGRVDSIADFVINPTRDKLKESTFIDRLQARLLPILDLTRLYMNYIIEIAEFRQNAAAYRKKYNRDEPVSFDALEEYSHSLAQWQRSIEGQAVSSAFEIAKIEKEIKAAENEFADAPGFIDRNR